VLLFAISEMSREQLEYASQKSHAKRLTLAPQVLPHDTTVPAQSGQPHGKFTLDYMEKVLIQNLDHYIQSEDAKITRNKRHVAILLPLARLFAQNQNSLNPLEEPLLVDIGRTLLNFHHAIAIEMELEESANAAAHTSAHKRGQAVAVRLQQLGYKHPIPVFIAEKTKKSRHIALLLTTREAGH
jgi:hypothetical protein